LIAIEGEGKAIDLDYYNNLIIEYELEVIDEDVVSIREGVVADSVGQSTLQIGKHTKNIINNSILVYLIVDLSKGGKCSISRRRIQSLLYVNYLYIASKIHIEESVVIRSELLHLVE
jgi:hypothetical protein